MRAVFGRSVGVPPARDGGRGATRRWPGRPILVSMSDPGDVTFLIRLSDEGRVLLDRLAAGAGMSPAPYLEELLRDAARRSSLAAPQEDAPALVLEATEEVPAIGPEGRGRKVRLKGIDETGEWDAGEIFVPDAPKR